MAYSYLLYTGDGTTTNFGVTFPYLQKADVSVLVNGVSTPFTWVNSTTVSVSPAPAGGAIVKVVRNTPKSTLSVVWTDGSTLASSSLNAENQQLLYIAQEGFDAAASAPLLNASNQYDALNHKIVNVADPTNPQDAVTKNYVDNLGVYAAQASATAAAASASSAAGSASAASTSATNASNSATAAAGSATTASNAATAASAALAAASLPGSLTAADGLKLLQVKSDGSGYQLMGPLTPTKNLIIGGDFSVNPWQRGTSFTGMAAGTRQFIADRFHFNAAGAVVGTGSQGTGGPDNYGTNFLQFAITTADTSIAAGDYARITHAIEGLVAQRLGLGTATAKTFTLSFWVKSAVTGTHCVAFQNSAQTRSYVATYTVNAANTWEYKTITVAGDTAGTWLSDTNAGLLVNWTLSGGSTFQTTAGSWQAGNFIATSAQVNVTGTVSNVFALDRIQLEVGSAATEFERLGPNLSLLQCLRYFERWTVSSLGQFAAVGYAWNGDRATFMLKWHPKRVTPSMTYTGGTFNINGYGGGAPSTTGIAGASYTPWGGIVTITASSAVTNGECRFLSMNTGCYIDMDAEF